jgi:hypothetical protein
MNAVRGRVRGGHVELDGELPEGSEVVVLPVAAGDAFDLSDEDAAELEARANAADKGQVESADAVLARLASRG